MLALRSRHCPQAPANPSHPGDDEAQTPQTQKNEFITEYEQSREERIKHNLEKMKKLGIFDLSLKLNSHIGNHSRNPKSSSRNKTSPGTSPLKPSGPVRRSSRLKNSTPLSYSEVDSVKKERALEDEDMLPGVGFKPEKYTEKHEKLLGNTEKSWTLFVDGVGKDGKRIYDQVNGKTCHQCRQKTLGYRTHCSRCNKVQGQFCGDCLYMRYGEHVLEALKNPKWVCPVCRGICNCSFCRQAKGWAPTGRLYSKVSQLGFKSVAHYLIQTRRLETKQDNSLDSTGEVSVKRSLPFSNTSAVHSDLLEVTNDQSGALEQFEDDSADEFNDSNDNQNSAKRSLTFLNIGLASESAGSLEVDHEVQYENRGVDNIRGEKDIELHEIEFVNCVLALPSSSKLHVQVESAHATESSIEKIDGHDDNLKVAEENDLDEKQTVNDILSEKEMDQKNDSSLACYKHEGGNKAQLEETPKVKETSPATTVNSDSISGRLKQRRRKVYDHDAEKISDIKQAIEGVSSENEVEKRKEVLPADIKHQGPLETSPKPKLKQKQKRVPANGPSPDSIAGRLSQRRRMMDQSYGD